MTRARLSPKTGTTDPASVFATIPQQQITTNVVLGLDPGFQATGWAVVKIAPNANTLIAGGVIYSVEASSSLQNNDDKALSDNTNNPSSFVKASAVTANTTDIASGNKVRASSAAGKISTSRARHDTAPRLQQLYQKVYAIIDHYQPDRIAIETSYVNKNPATSLKLAMARGVILAAIGAFPIAVTPYAPRFIKKAIAGNGNASKQLMMTMVQHRFHHLPKLTHDFADAIAVALCHNQQAVIQTAG